MKTTQYPNGTFTWRDANAAGQITAIYHRHGTLSSPLPASVPADASPIADYAYTYDIEGRRVTDSRTGGSLPTRTQSYTYDSLGRLSTYTLPSNTVRTYGYDLDTNRTGVTETPSGGVPAVIATYTYNTAVTPGLDQLTSVTQGGNTTSFSYSSDGDVTGYGANTLAFDGRGRHSGGTFGGTSVSYGFDAAGRRRTRTGGTSTTRFLFAGAGEAATFVTDAAGAIQQTDIAGPDGDLATYAGSPSTTSGVSYRYYDAHGDLAATADHAGSRTAAYTYDPFGAPNESVAANTTEERWTGRWSKKLDTTSNLIEMGVRPYDPVLGRFLAVDPVEGGNSNPYDYVGGDPCNSYDLSGRWNPCRGLLRGVSGWLGFLGRGPDSRGTAAISGAASMARWLITAERRLGRPARFAFGVASFGITTVLATSYNLGCRTSESVGRFRYRRRYLAPGRYKHRGRETWWDPRWRGRIS